MSTLSKQEIAVLLEALDCWDNKGSSELVLASVMGMVMARNDDERNRVQRERDDELKKFEGNQRVRRERSVILKAKLLGMRDNLDVDELLEKSKG